jgi:hypothetical protein
VYQTSFSRPLSCSAATVCLPPSAESRGQVVCYGAAQENEEERREAEKKFENVGLLAGAASLTTRTSAAVRTCQRPLHQFQFPQTFFLSCCVRLAASANFPLIRRKIHYPRRKLTFPLNQTGPPMALDSNSALAHCVATQRKLNVVELTQVPRSLEVKQTRNERVINHFHGRVGQPEAVEIFNMKIPSATSLTLLIK